MNENFSAAVEAKVLISISIALLNLWTGSAIGHPTQTLKDHSNTYLHVFKIISGATVLPCKQMG